MERIYLYVPPEEYAEVKASGACWDDASKRWYVDRDMVSATLSRWLGDGDDAQCGIESEEAFIAAAQTWDYFLGIGSIKRQQALLQATLVAQGAFSVYDTAALRVAGGWPDCIGEDIVMTWALLERGGRTTYEPSAVAFTEAPTTLRTLARQRRRWARGLRKNSPRESPGKRAWPRS